MATKQEVKEKVKKLVLLNEEQYQDNVLEYSYAFLEGKNYPKPIIDTLHKSPGYWVWWRNQFGIADLFFLNIYAVFGWDTMPLHVLRSQYKDCHINIKAYPSRLVEKINKKYVKPIKRSNYAKN